MARFRATSSGAAPLRIQISTPASGTAIICAFYAAGENASGSASHPTLTRPSTAGSGTGTAIPLTPSATAQSTVVTSFSSSPSLPGVTTGSFNLPIQKEWRAPLSQGFILAVGSHGLLYAAASGGHTWSGAVEWEEA